MSVRAFILKWFPRVMRGIATAGVGVIVLCGAATLVLWDADFYAVREKFEHVKIALFGEWQPLNWCPPGRETENCDQVSDFVAALEGAENFNFFRSMPVEGSDLVVITGVEFASALDVVASEPSHLWCYVTIGFGPVAQRITLSQVQAGSPPVFTDLSELSETQRERVPVGIDRLSALARTHCQFSEFSPSNS
jgi:hypothetical protein